MNESFPPPPKKAEESVNGEPIEKIKRVALEISYQSLAKELHESQERFAFPGIDPESYTTFKAAEQEFPGYTTPIDEIISRCAAEGIRVVIGKNGAVFILPYNSNDIEMDSIFPRHLNTNSTIDDKLKRLALNNLMLKVSTSKI